MMRALLACALAGATTALTQEYTKDMKTFGHSIKNGQLPPHKEITTFEHTCGTPPCVLTQIHVPSIYPQGGEPWRWEEGIVTFYLDGDKIQMTLLELALEGPHGAVGRTDHNGGPWGTELFGKTAKSGGVYSTIRIPFFKTLKVTIQASPAANSNNVFWMIVRGVEGYRVTVGDVLLPANARLRVDRFGPARVENLQMIPMASFANGTRGVLLAVRFDAESPDYTYLEACVRLVDPAGKPTFLSSGAEDYFLSASYFDEGMFKTENSGLTFFDGKGSVSAYKVHTNDLVFTQGGGELKWRVGEVTTGCGDMGHCPNQFCPGGKPIEGMPTSPPKKSNFVSSNVTYTTMVMRYEWAETAEMASHHDASSGLDRATIASLFTALDHGYLSAADAAAAAECTPAVCTKIATYVQACGPKCFATKDAPLSTLAATLIVKALTA